MDFSSFPRESVKVDEVIDCIPVGIAILDLDLRLQAMNRSLEAMTGFSREKATGVGCAHIIRNNLCTQQCPAKQALESDRAVHLEGNIINRERQKIPVMIHVSVLKDDKGQPLGVIETIEDISLLRELDKKTQITHDFRDLVGHSPKMQKLLDIVPIISQTDSSVLITGETGTGKDLIASVIHRVSPRAQGPFIKINCGALPETLLESELFGHTRGAFTGAVRDKPGRFQLADGGTLYLTEIGDLPLTLQADVRLIAATHRDLPSMVRQGSFREDLLFRLNVVRLEVPPLRERDGDIRLLMEYFLNKFNRQFQKKIKGFSPEAIEVLRRYPYPGNVRELGNMVEYATNVCHETMIKPEHLPDYLGKAWDESLQPEARETLTERDSFADLGEERMATRVAEPLLSQRQTDCR